MDIKPLEIKNKTNYDWNDVIYINDFDANSLEIIKRESRIGANIYYIRYVLDPDYDYNTTKPLYLVINRLIGYIEEIEGSSGNSDTDLPLNTMIEFRSILINVSCVIKKDNKYYPEIYLEECLYVKGNIWPTTT